MRRITLLTYMVTEDFRESAAISDAFRGTDISVNAYAESARFLADFTVDRPCVILLGTCNAGSATLERLYALHVSQPVIVVSSTGTVALCRHAFKHGARDFLESPIDASRLVEVVRQSFSDYIQYYSQHNEERVARERYGQLTTREREVAELIISGMTSREIGRALCLSQRTIEVHRARIAEKLQTQTLAQLVRTYAPLIDET